MEDVAQHDVQTLNKIRMSCEEIARNVKEGVNDGFVLPQDVKALVMGGVAICNKFSVLLDSLLQRLAGGDRHTRTRALARHRMGICCREVVFTLEE